MKPTDLAVWERCARDLERSVVEVDELGELGAWHGSESPYALTEVAKKALDIKPIPLAPASHSWNPASKSEPTAEEVWDYVVGSLPPLPGSDPPPDLAKVMKGLGVGPSVEATDKMPPSDPASISAWLAALARKNEAEKRSKRKGK